MKRKPMPKPKPCWICHEVPAVGRRWGAGWVAQCHGPYDAGGWTHSLYVYGKTRRETVERWNAR